MVGTAIDVGEHSMACAIMLNVGQHELEKNQMLKRAKEQSYKDGGSHTSPSFGT